MTGGVSPDSLEVERTSLRSVGADSSNRRLWFKLRLSHRRGTGRTIRVRAHRRCQGREHPPPRPPPAVGRERDDAARAITTSRRPRTGRMKAAEAAADAARPGVATERRRCRRGTARSDPGGTVTFTAASGHDPHPDPAATAGRSPFAARARPRRCRVRCVDRCVRLTTPWSTRSGWARPPGTENAARRRRREMVCGPRGRARTF